MKEHLTAATANYLLERVGRRVALCEQQGGQWITIRRSITLHQAGYFGFNPQSPAVMKVFGLIKG